MAKKAWPRNKKESLIKYCHKCGEVLDSNNWYLSDKNCKKKGRVAPNYICKLCSNCRRDRARDKYTPLEYAERFEKQKGLCAICGLPSVQKYGGKRKKLHADHNHITKQIRGLLCFSCNAALGLLKVDNFGILNLQKSINYLLEAEKNG